MIYRMLCLMCIIVFISSAAGAIEVTRVRSAGGLEAWLVQDSTVEAFSLRLMIPGGGTAYDPDGKEGRAHLAASLLDEGAGSRDAQAFQEALDFHAITMGFGVSKDVFTGSMTTLSEHAEMAFSLLHDALSSPHFVSEDVMRLKAEHLAALRHGMSDPTFRARRAMHRTLFAGHPYSRPGMGTPETVTALQAADMHAYKARHLHRAGMILSVAGDISPAELQHWMEQYLDPLPEGKVPEPLPAVAPDFSGRHDIHMDVPQTVVLFAMPGIERRDERFFTAFILNHLLGGSGLSSRLGLSIREKEGLAYYAYSGLSNYDQAALISGAFATRREAVDKAISIFREEVASLGQGGPDPEEFRDGVRYLTGSFPAKLTSNRSVTAYLQSMQRYGLGIDYLDKRNAYLEAVSREEAEQLAKTLFNPEKLLIMAVGSQNKNSQ